MNVETLRVIPGIVAIIVIAVLLVVVVNVAYRSIFANDELSRRLNEVDKELRRKGL